MNEQVFALVAFVLAVVALIRSRAQSLEAWAIVFLALAHSALAVRW